MHLTMGLNLSIVKGQPARLYFQIPEISRCKDEYSSTWKTASAAKTLSDSNVSFGKGAKGVSVSRALPGVPGECARVCSADRHSCSLTQSFHF